MTNWDCPERPLHDPCHTGCSEDGRFIPLTLEEYTENAANAFTGLADAADMVATALHEQAVLLDQVGLALQDMRRNMNRRQEKVN